MTRFILKVEITHDTTNPFYKDNSKKNKAWFSVIDQWFNCVTRPVCVIPVTSRRSAVLLHSVSLAYF